MDNPEILDAQNIKALWKIKGGKLIVSLDPEYDGSGDFESLVNLAHSVLRSLVMAKDGRLILSPIAKKKQLRKDKDMKFFEQMAVKVNLFGKEFIIPVVYDEDRTRSGMRILFEDDKPTAMEIGVPGNIVALNSVISSIQNGDEKFLKGALMRLKKNTEESIGDLIQNEVIKTRVPGFGLIAKSMAAFNPEKPELGGLQDHEIGMSQELLDKLGWEAGEWHLFARHPLLGYQSLAPFQVVVVPNMDLGMAAVAVPPWTLETGFLGDCDGDRIYGFFRAIEAKFRPKWFWQLLGLDLIKKPNQPMIRPWYPDPDKFEGVDYKLSVANFFEFSPEDVLRGRLQKMNINKLTWDLWVLVVSVFFIFEGDTDEEIRERIIEVQKFVAAAGEEIFDAKKAADGSSVDFQAVLDALSGQYKKLGNGQLVPVQFPTADLQTVDIDDSVVRDILNRCREKYSAFDGNKMLCGGSPSDAVKINSSVLTELVVRRRNPSVRRLYDAFKETGRDAKDFAAFITAAITCRRTKEGEVVTEQNFMQFMEDMEEVHARKQNPASS